MIPNFALALSFEGISLLRRMGPRWARLDEVSLDHADFDSAVIALRDFAESLDPTGAQVALVIPNEQIRYLDQPDLGGTESTRDVAIRAALDGATPYLVNDLNWDHVISGGRLMVAAVAQETLDEARSFAVEHGFEPVCYLAKAPDPGFDGAVFFGKAEGWSRAVSRPARAIEIVAANKAALSPLPKMEQSTAEQSKPEESEQEQPKQELAKPELADPKPVADPPATPKPEAVKPPAEQPAPVAAPSPFSAPVEHPAPVEAADPTPVAAAIVPSPATEAPATPKPAPNASAVNAPADELPKPAAPAPAPQVQVQSAAPIPPAEPPAAAPKSPVEAAIAAHKGKAADPAPAAPKAETPAIPPELPPAPQAAPGTAPLAFSSIRAARGVPAQSEAPALGPALSDDFKPRFTPVVTESHSEDMAETPPKGSGFFARPTASALLAEASAAADAAEGITSEPAATAPKSRQKPQPKPAPQPQLKSPAKQGPAANPLTAEGPKFPPKTAQAPKAPAKEKSAATLPPKLAGKLKAKPGVKAIPKSPSSRAAALAAVPAYSPDAGEILDTPVAARRALAQPKTKAKTGAANPLAKLAALRGPRAALPAGGQMAGAGAAALPAGGMSFNTSEERNRMTVFGERDRGEVGGKPRFLGLMLVAILLLFLAGVAAWASVFLDDGLARLFRGGSTASPTAVASLPAGDATPDPAGSDGVILETASPDAGAGGGLAVTLGKTATEGGAAPDAPTRPVARPESEVQLAAFEAKGDQLANGALPLSVPLTPRTLSPEEASVSYAATGIWQRSPSAPMTPPEDGVEDIYVASIDPNIQIFDAVALPEAARLAPGLPLADPGLPPPSDLTFEFDQRNLIRATPEGALSPDGLRIFTGRPPVIPPLRDDSGAGAAPDPTAAQPDDVQLAALARVRPAARPEDVIEQRERVQLGGVSLAELARFRPVMRPQTVQERAEIDSPDATEQAVTASLVPVGRPRNMAAIVEQAVKRPDPQPVQTAAVAPRTIQPNLPSSASVARSATLENAINLNRINLIGVYGTPDNRRALVRLPNGKYEKVKVGDRLDGGRVSAIGDGDLRYKKGSRDVVLKMPRG